jgi:uncharacterized repeat protein (TIGR02543 family)
MTAPAAGAVPQTVAHAESATGNAGYTVTGLTWNEALTAGSKFKASNTTVTITHTASASGVTAQTANLTVNTPLGAAWVTITPPLPGAAPQTTAQAEAATANADYTFPMWCGTGNSKTEAGQVYTATITLTSKNGKEFQAAAFTPTVAGAFSVGTTTTTGAGVGNTVTFTVAFPETDQPGTVTFSSNGLTYATKTVNAGESVGAGNFPSDPTRSSYTFGGWFTGENGAGTQFTSATPVNTTLTVYAKWTYSGGGGSNNGGGAVTPPPEKTIVITETSSDLFRGSTGEISAGANMENAFTNSVEVKVTDTDEDKASFKLGAGDEVYPFDISLYIKGTNEKTQPAPGYAVTISLPVPANLLDRRERLSVVHKADNGVVTPLNSRLEERNSVWYLVLEATEFSPYALVINNADEAQFSDWPGLPEWIPPWLLPARPTPVK